MKVLTASAPSHLKLVLHTTNNNAFSDAPDYAYLEISAAEAQALIDLIGLAQQFRRQTGDSGLIETCYDISFGLGPRLPMFQVTSVPFADNAEPNQDTTIVVLPENFDPDAVSDSLEYPVECHRVEVGHDSVRFCALLKHGDDRFVTTSLSEQLLRVIANDQPTALPRARLDDCEK